MEVKIPQIKDSMNDSERLMEYLECAKANLDTYSYGVLTETNPLLQAKLDKALLAQAEANIAGAIMMAGK